MACCFAIFSYPIHALLLDDILLSNEWHAIRLYFLLGYNCAKGVQPCLSHPIAMCLVKALPNLTLTAEPCLNVNDSHLHMNVTGEIVVQYSVRIDRIG